MCIDVFDCAGSSWGGCERSAREVPLSERRVACGVPLGEDYLYNF